MNLAQDQVDPEDETAAKRNRGLGRSLGIRQTVPVEQYLAHFENLHEQHGHTVRVLGDVSKLLDELSPKVLAVQTFTLDVNGTATSQYRVPFRSLYIDAPLPAAASTSNANMVTNPGAGTSLVSLSSLAAGWYDVVASVNLAGTVTTADGNNMFLNASSGAPAFAPIAYPGVAGANVSASFKVHLTTAGFIQIETSNAASGAAAVYGASITATPAQVSQLLTVAGMPLQSSPPGQGPGVAMVRRGGSSLVNLRAYQWSLYGGNPGDQVTVTAMTTAQAPNR